MAKEMFCTNCGAVLEEGSLFCSNCGQAVLDISTLTQNSGYAEENKDLELKEDAVSVEQKSGHSGEKSDDFEALKGAAAASAQKALDGAHDLVGKISKKMEDSKTESNVKIEDEIKKQKLEIEKQKKKMRMNSKSYMSGKELWSWLKQSSKRQHFYTEQISVLTEEEYFKDLEAKISENLVPAVIEKKSFQWDRGGLHREDYIVKPLTAAVNPLSCLIQFTHIGKFTFVEEKTFITPPNLPDVPLKKKPIDENLIKTCSTMMTYGIIMFVVGLILSSFISIGPTIAVLGAALFGVGILLLMKNKSVIAYNQKCDEMEKAWEEAWSNWIDSIFIHSFQEDVNGQVSRIYDSVFECIKQVNDELFNAKEVVEVSESTSINDLEACIARRKEEYR